MKHLRSLLLVATVGFAAPFASAQSPAVPPSTATLMTTVSASGPFEVKMTPQSPADAAVGRFVLEKQYHGDLEATATGEMLTAMTATKGSAGYVAIEKVTGKLNGRSGAFHLQHSGTMNRGAPTLTVAVVPDSGTGELAGLAGTLRIDVAPDGTHRYTFEYSLPQ